MRKGDVNAIAREQIARYVRAEIPTYTLATFFVVLDVGCGLGGPLALGALVDAAVQEREGALVGRVILLGAVILGHGFAFIAHAILFRRASERVAHALRVDLFERLLAHPLSFHRGARGGALGATFLSDVSRIQATLETAPAHLVRHPLVILGGAAMMLRVSPLLTVVLLGCAAPLVLGATRFGARMTAAVREAQAAYGEAAAAVHESLSLIETVYALGVPARHLARYRERSAAAVRAANRSVWAEAAYAAGTTLALFVCLSAVFWLAGILVSRHSLTSGALVAVVGYAVYLQGGISGASQILGSIRGALGAAEHLFEVVPEPPQKPPPRVHALPARSGTVAELHIDNVSFAYTPSERRVLDGFSLTLQSGELCVLLGPSGSGKSTLLRLIAGLESPIGGRVLVAGEAVGDLSMDIRATAIGYVTQEAMLFSGTILDNICGGYSAATLDEVRAAAGAAFAAGFIERLPAEYETHVGERGVTLSGGERQRVALARALLRRPRILLLDEPTSGLDADSLRAVEQALVALRGECTVIVATHRRSLAANADVVAHIGEVAAD